MLRFIRSHILLVILPLCTSGPAQSLLWDRTAPVPSGGVYGTFVYRLEDINHDGFDDVLVSSPGASSGSLVGAGYVEIVSGADGSSLRQYAGPTAGANWQAPGAIGDVDGDGSGDFLLCAAGSPQQIISGASGAVLGTVPWGCGVNSAGPVGDVNGDGFGDFAIGSAGGSPGPVPGAGFVTVYAGPSGTQLFQSYGQHDFDAFGWSMAPLGDVNNDGVPDFFVGAPGPPLKFVGVPGWAHVCSGADGAILRQWTGPVIQSRFGVSVNSAGDVDGDGVPDVIVGSHHVFARSAWIYSGASGGELAVFHGPLVASTLYGNVVRGLGDVDGDGVPDQAIHGTVLEFEIRSGATRDIIYTFSDPFPPLPPGASAGWHFAGTFEAVGDVTGDGFPDVAVGNPARISGIQGRVQVYSLAPQGVTTFGSGCPQASGVVPRVGATRTPGLGADFALNVSRVPVGVCAGLILGRSNTEFGSTPLPWNVAPWGLPPCELLVAIDAFFPVLTHSVGPGAGAASVPFHIPPVAALSGLSFFAQWAVEGLPGTSDPIGLTKGLEIVIQ